MKKLILLCLLLVSTSVFSASSASERADKKLELTLQAGGDYRMSPTQFSAMYFLDGDNLIGLKAGVDRQSKEHQTSVALQYKHYTGNSFYVAGEIFYLNTREDLDWFLSDIFNTPSDYAEYSSMGAGIRIGNQWTWDLFTIGADWIGVGRRVGTFNKDTDKLDETTLTFLNVIVGISF